MSLVTVRPHLLRVHRWTAIGLAPVLLVVILSGLVLSFEPILSDLDARADRSAGVNADALKALVARLAGAGRITTITAADGGRSLGRERDARSRRAATIWRRASDGRFGRRPRGLPRRRRAPRVAALGLGAVVDLATIPMVPMMAMGPFILCLKFTNTLMAGTRRPAGWLFR